MVSNVDELGELIDLDERRRMKEISEMEHDWRTMHPDIDDVCNGLVADGFAFTLVSPIGSTIIELTWYEDDEHFLLAFDRATGVPL